MLFHFVVVLNGRDSKLEMFDAVPDVAVVGVGDRRVGHSLCPRRVNVERSLVLDVVCSSPRPRPRPPEVEFSSN